MLFFLNAISVICSTLLIVSYLFWHTISPIQSSPIKARRNTHLNSFISYGDEHICGNASIILVSSGGVIGNLVSGVPASSPAPLRAALTKNDAQGSSQSCVLCQLLIAQTYEFIVAGAFLFIDSDAMNLIISLSEAGPFVGGECIFL